MERHNGTQACWLANDASGFVSSPISEPAHSMPLNQSDIEGLHSCLLSLLCAAITSTAALGRLLASPESPPLYCY
jgi:hypothetical protein